MRGYIITFVLLLVLVPVALALSGPYTYNGKEYYVVTADDPTEDTGDEVCAKAGKTCVGYTEESTAVCRMVHPSAQETSSLSGDQSAVYCDGSPQKGVCADKSDSCHACPGCTVNVDCGTPIGSLYREMYVECADQPAQKQQPTHTRSSYASNACQLNPNANSLNEFIAEVPSLNGKLKSCTLTMPSSFGAVTSNGQVQIDVQRNDGSHEYFDVTIRNKQLTGIAHAQNSCAQRITISEDDANLLLRSADRASTFQYLYANKRITLSGCTFFRKAYSFFTAPISRFVVRQTLPPPPPQQNVPSPQPGTLVCDFYNGPTKKLVTCAANRAGDTFCANVMGSRSAKAIACDENGQILCSVPCSSYSAVKLTNRCAFDINRARGTQAPPIGSCPSPAAQSAQGGTGKPANCDDTYLPGHRGYAQNRATWDRYSAGTDGVCQSQYGRGVPNGCVHTVQLSVQGKPYYLCWYRN